MKSKWLIFIITILLICDPLFSQVSYDKPFKVILLSNSPEIVNSFKNFLKNLYYYQIQIDEQQSANKVIFSVTPHYLREDIYNYLYNFGKLSKEFSVSISDSNILISPTFTDKKVFFVELYNFIVELKTRYKKPEIAFNLLNFFQGEVKKQNREVYYNLEEKIVELKDEIQEELELLEEFREKLDIFKYGSEEKNDLYNFINNNYNYLTKKLDDDRVINNLKENLSIFTDQKMYLDVYIPEEKGYLNTGMNEPIIINVYYIKDGKKLYIRNAPLLISNVDRADFKKILFLNEESSYIDSEILVFTDDYGTARFFIRAFADITNNKFVVKLGGLNNIDEILNYLQNITYINKNKLINNLFYSSVYKLPQPHNAYSEYYSQYQPDKLSPISAKIRNAYISIAVNSAGQFTIGAENFPQSINKKMDMLYGHPNNVSADGIWSSFTTIRCNDSDYKFHTLETVSFRTNKNNITITKRLDNILITQVLCITNQVGYTNKDTCKIIYKITNTSLSNSEKVGIRIMLDTWAGFNDGVPFRLPLYDYESEDNLIVTEYDVPTINMGYWECYENMNEEGTVILSGNLISDNTIYPDRFVMAKWPKIYDTLWDYDVDEDAFITGDSAVGIWWYERDIPPKESFKIHTYYGLKEIREGIFKPQVVWDFNNPFLISFVKKNNTDAEKLWKVKVLSLPDNIELFPGEISTKAKSISPDKEERISFKFRALNSLIKSPEIKFQEIYNNKQKIKKVKIKISADNGLLSLPIINEFYKPINITYSPDIENKPQEGEYLIGALVDKNGNYIKKVILYDDGLHNDGEPNDNVYGNIINLDRDVSGQYKVVIYMVKVLK